MENNHWWELEAEDVPQVGVEAETGVDQKELIGMANLIGQHLVPHLLPRG